MNTHDIQAIEKKIINGTASTEESLAFLAFFDAELQAFHKLLLEAKQSASL